MSDPSQTAATTAGRQPRLIKRYANRKMYDTERSCYITLEEVADMVRAGEDLRVIDNKTKSDLTEVTLTQALLHSERKKRGSVSIDSLRHLFAQGGELLQSRVGAPVARAASEAERTVEKWRNEAERTVGRVWAPKKEDERADEVEAAVQKVVEELSSVPPEVTAQGQGGEPKKSGGTNVEQTERARDEWQSRIDERLRLLVSALTSPTQSGEELTRLQQRVATLEERVAKLEQALHKSSSR